MDDGRRRLHGGGPSVTATETGTYTALVTNPVNGCVSTTEVPVFAADEAPLLNGAAWSPSRCLNPGQPVVGAGVQDYAPFGPEGLTPIVSWTNADNGTTMGVSV